MRRFDHYSIVGADTPTATAIRGATADARGFGAADIPECVHWKRLPTGHWLLRLEFR